MTRAKQLSLLKDPRRNTKLWWIQKQHAYGGALDYRKVARPFDSKKVTHAVLKARLGASLRFTRSQSSIRKVINVVAAKYSVKIRDLAINHDHIHLLFSARTREDQRSFLRLLAAELGRKYKGLLSKFGIRRNGSMWVHRPFTRLVAWGKRSLQNVTRYLEKNRNEACGFVEYEPRKHRLTEFLSAWASSLAGNST